MQVKVAFAGDRGHGFVMIWLIRDRYTGDEIRCAFSTRAFCFPRNKKKRLFRAQKRKRNVSHI